jgi:hypothetical protein
MKKLFIFVLVTSIVLIGFAQERGSVSKELLKMSVKQTVITPVDLEPPMLNYNYVPSGPVKSTQLLGDEVEILHTRYDLPTNTALSNRIWAWQDGTIAAVTTYGWDEPAGAAFPDRGTGYNYFDGTDWMDIPSARVETERTGWPSVAPLGNTGEIIVSHQSATAPLLLNKRETKGTGDWMQSTLEGPPGHMYLWPRMAASGENNEYTHLFALTPPEANGGALYLGQDGALLYNRSSDGGETWDIEHFLIEGIGAEYYANISGDAYSIATRGSTIAVVSGNSWINDLFMLKSTDNGATWEKTVLWEHPIPFFDYTTTVLDDTLFCPGDAYEVAIDANGMCHVVFNVTRILQEAATPNGEYSIFPMYDGITYWNETMEAPIPEPDDVPGWVQEPQYWTLNPDILYDNDVLIGYSQDVNGNGQLDFVDVPSGEFPFADYSYRWYGLSFHPTLTITDNGIIAVAYSSVTEGYANPAETKNYRRIWARVSPDLGTTWGEFYDIQLGNIFHDFDESIFPQFAPNSSVDDDYFHLLYNADETPGLFLNSVGANPNMEQSEPTTNRIIYNKLAKSEIVGINEPVKKLSKINISQNYPNPATGATEVTVDLNEPADVSLELFNMTGQKVLDIPARTMQAGTQHMSFDVSAFTPGVYFYTVTAGNEKATRKMIVN